VPTLFTFPQLPDHFIPRVDAAGDQRPHANLNDQMIDSAIERWRGATMTKRLLEGAR
jgi:hypothetical protein